MTHEPFHLSAPRSIDGLLTRPTTATTRPPYPTVVVCHGFKGFMEWGFFPPLAELLADRGFLVVRFNFSGIGMRPGEDRVTDLEAFASNTFTQELEDVLGVLGALDDEIAPGLVDRSRVALLGHSRGGGIALLAAAHAELPLTLAGLVTWAAISTIDRLLPAELEAWRRTGTYTIVNSRTGQELPIGIEVLEDAERNAATLDIEAAAARRSCPWLLLHGTDDETVPLREGRRLAEVAAAPSELIEIPGGGHTFGAVHPFAGPTPELIRVFNESQRWLRRRLLAG